MNLPFENLENPEDNAKNFKIRAFYVYERLRRDQAINTTETSNPREYAL